MDVFAHVRCALNVSEVIDNYALYVISTSNGCGKKAFHQNYIIAPTVTRIHFW